MKKNLLLSVLFTFIFVCTAQAQQAGKSQPHHPGQQQTDTQQKQGMGGMMGGQDMGGMMGGQGMGMMGGQDMGMTGQGMGGGMMHGGMHRMHRSMMAKCGGWSPGMKNFKSPESHADFLNDTKELRRSLHNLRFEYGEKARNPETTVGELQKMEEQMSDLQKQIMDKAAQSAQQ